MPSNSPTPSSATSTSGATNTSEWRAAVQQAHRNTEVREISRVLAALEPGATAASKLRLAMQFEDAVFKSATSLADYRKRLTKRLKKLQRNYVPPAVPAASTTAVVSNKEAVLKELCQTYGDALLYILKHAKQAIIEMRKRHGEEKAGQLQQHTDGVKVWATDLGLLPGSTLNKNMSREHLEKLKGHLERRTENIRSHVVKLADNDQFIKETLAKRERDFNSLSSGRPSRILAECTRRRYEHLYHQMHNHKPLQADELLIQAMDTAQAAVPLPAARDKTTQQGNDEKAALEHLDKMRAASTVCLAYMGIPDKATVPKETVVKAHTIATQGIHFCTRVLRAYRQAAKEELQVTLEDAWMKPLVLASEEEPVLEQDGKDSPVPPSPRKRQRLVSPVVRSRVLLTANRKTPSNLLPALKRKRARLVRPPPTGVGSHLVLEFGEQAFVMTIYLVPLVVTLRASDGTSSNADDTKKEEMEDNVQCASWTPLHHGLTERQDLTVWGAKGDYATLGSVVEERLRDASAHATAVLRQCFAAAAKAVGDFETEILEATALLEFLQVARTTYMPDWQDDDSV